MGYLAQKLSDRPSNQDVEKAIIEIRHNILERVSPLEIWVFGSAAQNRITGASDIDIAIIFWAASDVRNQKTQLRRSGPLSEFFPVDILVFDKASFEAKSQVGGVCMEIKNGRKIYGQDSEI